VSIVLGRERMMVDYEKRIAVQDELVTRRKRALTRKKDRTVERSGVLSERGIRRLIKQAQRRRAKLVRDRDRRAGGEAT
jgi:hypothetical protein